MRKLIPLAVAVAMLAVPSFASAGGGYPPPDDTPTANPLSVNRACGFAQRFESRNFDNLEIDNARLRRLRIVAGLADEDNNTVHCAFVATLRVRQYVGTTSGYSHNPRPRVRLRRYGCLGVLAITRASDDDVTAENVRGSGRLRAELEFNRCVRLRRASALFPRIDSFLDGPFDDRSPEPATAAAKN